MVVDAMVRRGAIAQAISHAWRWSGAKPLRSARLFVKYGVIPLIPVLGDVVYKRITSGEVHCEAAWFLSDAQVKRDAAARAQYWRDLSRRAAVRDWGRCRQVDYLWPRARYLDAGASGYHPSHAYYDREVIELGAALLEVPRYVSGSASHCGTSKSAAPKGIRNRLHNAQHVCLAGAVRSYEDGEGH